MKGKLRLPAVFYRRVQDPGSCPETGHGQDLSNGNSKKNIKSRLSFREYLLQ